MYGSAKETVDIMLKRYARWYKRLNVITNRSKESRYNKKKNETFPVNVAENVAEKSA